jgi:hypothetical protein
VEFLVAHAIGETGALLALLSLGLADCQVVRAKGEYPFTAYWLTPAGVERARQLQRAPNG